MLNFIDKHKQLLLYYRTTLRILGWILLCMGVVGYELIFAEYLHIIDKVNSNGTLGLLERSGYILISLGLASLGFAQFVRYLCGNNKMGLLLRHGDKIFYFFAFIVIWGVGVQIWLVPPAVWVEILLLIYVGLYLLFRHYYTRVQKYSY